MGSNNKSRDNWTATAAFLIVAELAIVATYLIAAYGG